MLTIRKQQMEIFQAEAEERFVDTLIAHLRRWHADKVIALPEDILRWRVEYGIERARSYGITWESNIGAFLGLMFEISPRFDTQENTQQCLRDEAITPDWRIDVMMKKLVDEDWERATESDGGYGWAEIDGEHTKRQSCTD